MSALGTKWAVVSLQMGCQISDQIDKSIDFLRGVVGDDTLTKSSMPFDWVFVTPDSVARMLDAQEIFPEDPSQLVIRRKIAHWDKYNAWFWHAFVNTSRIWWFTIWLRVKLRLLRREVPTHVTRSSIRAQFAEARETHVRRLQRFFGLRDLKGRLFVISNVQNNLADPRVNMDGEVDFILHQESVDRLIASIHRAMGDERSQFCVVSYADRIDPGFRVENGSLHIIDKDPTEWQGTTSTWHDIYSKHFAQFPPSAV